MWERYPSRKKPAAIGFISAIENVNKAVPISE
jgi:hypothetical protein